MADTHDYIDNKNNNIITVSLMMKDCIFWMQIVHTVMLIRFMMKATKQASKLQSTVHYI